VRMKRVEHVDPTDELRQLLTLLDGAHLNADVFVEFERAEAKLEQLQSELRQATTLNDDLVASRDKLRQHLFTALADQVVGKTGDHVADQLNKFSTALKAAESRCCDEGGNNNDDDDNDDDDNDDDDNGDDDNDKFNIADARDVCDERSQQLSDAATATDVAYHAFIDALLNCECDQIAPLYEELDVQLSAEQRLFSDPMSRAVSTQLCLAIRAMQHNIALLLNADQCRQRAAQLRSRWSLIRDAPSTKQLDALTSKVATLYEDFADEQFALEKAKRRKDQASITSLQQNVSNAKKAYVECVREKVFIILFVRLLALGFKLLPCKGACRIKVGNCRCDRLSRAASATSCIA
jgi:hypothetical protein